MGKRKWNGSKWIRPDKRLAIHIRDRFMCIYCSMDLRNAGPRELTLDHYIPAEHGGTNGAGNLVTACDSCNSGKKDLQAVYWFQTLGRRRGYVGPELFEYINGALARAEFQMSRPLNRRLAKALIDGRQPTLWESLPEPWK